jgi:hypothetical protein
MNHSLDKVGTPCPICKLTICLEEYHGMGSETYCSEYCDSVGAKDIEAFKNAAPGDWCLYPCCHCGTTLEGEWDPASYCSDCSHDVKLENLKQLLREARDLLEKSPLRVKGDWSERLVPDNEAKELVKKIELGL